MWRLATLATGDRDFYAEKKVSIAASIRSAAWPSP
jgi:hypothetical protein